jgi:hypothetical protein
MCSREKRCNRYNGRHQKKEKIKENKPGIKKELSSEYLPIRYNESYT